tara:strand:+ start:1204 stop:2553 length:1350 start_codon:yes stop_codon:yes gene_type:complete
MSKKENIAEVLSTIYHQKLDVYLNDSSVLHEINIKGDAVTCTFIEYPGSVEINQLKHKIEEKIFELKWVKEIEIKLRVIPTSTTKRTAGLENISQIIAVSSCKGGVGKSTIAMNIATAYKLNGARVGLFDADIHGPSLPTLITPTEMSEPKDETTIPTFINNGIKLMSYGYIQENASQPAILRGPIASNIFKQLLLSTDWGQLDVLIIDCPPGTGDVLLSITQEVALTSAIIITTPHELSYVDVIKGIEMFKKVKVPVSSIIENMSYFSPPDSDEKYHIFGKGRLIPTAKKYEIPNWYQLPINEQISSYNNKKVPYLLNAHDNDAQTFKKMINDIVWEHVYQSTTSNFEISHNNKTRKIEIIHNQKKSEISYKNLRLECQCAFCVDEMTREKIIKPSDIDPKLSIKKLYKVGHYAYGIDWEEHNKSHQSMYPIDALIALTLDKMDSASK